MTPRLTVAICAHNPRREYLQAALNALRAQEVEPELADWELLLIDNASAEPLQGQVDLSWRPGGRVVREERLGLTHARLRSFHEAKGDIIIYVDDDNILDPSYLQCAWAAMGAPRLGAVGGKVLPRYEEVPPAWFGSLGLDLACRDLGDEPLSARWNGGESGDRSYPACAPVGAGMAIRKSAYAAYVEAAGKDTARTNLGRRGTDLASGEDNDMVLTLLGLGWEVAYRPELRVDHLIPSTRLQPDYLARYAYSTNRTWVQVLDVHGIRPWPAVAPWSAGLRKLRAWFRLQPWRDIGHRVRWCSACGVIDGRAQLRPGTP